MKIEVAWELTERTVERAMPPSSLVTRHARGMRSALALAAEVYVRKQGTAAVSGSHTVAQAAVFPHRGGVAYRDSHGR